MKWENGRQKDSYVIKISATDCYKLYRGEKPRDLKKCLKEILEDYENMQISFLKRNNRYFNCSK